MRVGYKLSYLSDKIWLEMKSSAIMTPNYINYYNASVNIKTLLTALWIVRTDLLDQNKILREQFLFFKTAIPIEPLLVGFLSGTWIKISWILLQKIPQGDAESLLMMMEE